MLARLKDGTRIRIRPIAAEDREQLAAEFERLSPDSRYRRFFTPVTRLSDRELDYLTQVDHRNHEALVAIDEATGAGVAVARFVRLDGDAAEPAIVVADDWQRRGVASRLLEALVGRAREEGIRQFVALVLAENKASIALFERLGETTHEHAGQQVELTIDLSEPARANSVLGEVLRACATGLLEPAHLLWELVWRRIPGSAGLRDAIVVATDGSDEATFALECASELAVALGSVVHVVATQRPLLDDRASVEDQLRDALRRLHDAGITAEPHLGRGDPVLSILYVALRERAGLVVIGSEPDGDRAGGVSPNRWDAIAHSAQCNVLIARRRAHQASRSERPRRD